MTLAGVDMATNPACRRFSILSFRTFSLSRLWSLIYSISLAFASNVSLR